MRVLLIVYDNNSYTHYFPQGLGYIAAVLKKKGAYVEIYNQDIHHYPEEHLTEYLKKNKFDIVGIGIIAGYYQYKKLLSITNAINKVKNRPYLILGGHGPSPEPEYFLKKMEADIVVIGEGEETIVELFDALKNHNDLKKIKGIAFFDNGKVTINERRPLIKNIDNIPIPAYELFPIEYYRLLREPNHTSSDFLMPVLSGRGCTFKCNFCYRMDQGFRPRSSNRIIEEIKLLKKNYGITYIVFSDELLMSSLERIILLCKDIIKAKLNIKWWCNGRLNYAKPEVLNLMKKAGCVFINYGIESLDDTVLKNINKALSVKQIIKGVESTLKCGISPGLNVIFGNIGDNTGTLKKAMKFLLKYCDGSELRTIRPVTPYPGSPLYYYAIKKGFLKGVEDFYENRHINSDLLTVNFTNLSNEEFHKKLFYTNKVLLENYYRKNLIKQIEIAKKLYFDKNIIFRGFRQL